MKELKLLVTVDINDGDYLTEESDIEEEDWEKFKGIFSKLPDGTFSCSGYRDINDPVENGWLTEEEYDWLQEWFPYGECGFHTVEKVELRVVEVLETL